MSNVCTSCWDTVTKYKRLSIVIAASLTLIVVVIILSVALSSKKNKKKDPEPEPATAWEKYLKAKKYLYMWEFFPHQYTLDMVKDHNFSRVYVSIGEIAKHWDDYFSKGNLPDEYYGDIPYQDMIQKFNDLGVEVELVTFLSEYLDDFTDVDRALEVAKIVKNLSKKVKIKALHFDQESSDPQSFEPLLKMYKDLSDIFPTSAIIRPYWLTYKMSSLKTYFNNQTFYNYFSDCETVVDAIMKVTKYTDLMAYNQLYNVSDKYMETLLNISKRHTNHEAKSIIEVGWGDGVPEDDTMHQRYVEDKDKFFTFIYDSSKKYDGICIHYFEMWYKTLYCYWPSTKYPYENGEPKVCKW